jgi:O-antigen/teichoic acid export membrane protein
MSMPKDASEKTPADLAAVGSPPALDAPPSNRPPSLPAFDLLPEGTGGQLSLPPETMQAPQPSMKQVARSAAIWILVGFGAMYVLKFFSSVILTRQLPREAFGLMNLVTAILTGLHMFSDVGISQAVIQSPRGDDPDFLDTAWTMHILRGLGIWLCALLIAWPFAAWYDESSLLWLIPVVGLEEAILSFSSTSLFTLSRRLMRGRLMALEIAKAILYLTVTLIWVFWVQRSVWALVAGLLVSSIFEMGISHFLLPGHRNRFRWDPRAVHEQFHFGKWIFLGTICTFLGFQSDRFIVPAIGSFADLGVYGVAGGLVNIGTGLMSAFAGQLVFPVYSQLQQMGRDIRAAFVRVHTSAAAFAALLVTGLLSTGPTGVRAIYPADFEDAGWMVQFLAVGAWFQMLEGTAGAALLALGQPRAVLYSNATKCLGLLVFVPLGLWLGGLTQFGGFIGMLVGFVVSDFVRYLVVVWIAGRNGMSAWIYDIGLSVLIVALSLAGTYLGDLLARKILGGVPQARWQEFVQFLCEGVTVVVLWSMVFLVWWRRGSFRFRPQVD